MKCPNCGNEIEDKSVFCGMCGARLVPEPEEAPPVEEDACEPEPEQPEFKLRHCPSCGAALPADTDFCGNCGAKFEEAEESAPAAVWSAAEDEPRPANTPAPNGGGRKLVAAVAALIIIMAGLLTALYFLGGHDIEGEWVVDNDGGLFGMFSESYMDFDDGNAVYYNGLFSSQRYPYSYNRLTRTLTLYGAGRSGEDMTMRVSWSGNDTCVIHGLDMTLHRTDDIPYSYEEDDDDIIHF